MSRPAPPITANLGPVENLSYPERYIWVKNRRIFCIIHLFEFWKEKGQSVALFFFTMITLLSPNYVETPTSRADLAIASVVWGFTLGFGFLTVWEAIKNTMRQENPWRSTYIHLIWGEVVVCTAFGIICYMHLLEAIPGSFAFYFCILTFWALQVQFLLQIIINRLSVILPNRKRALYVKWGVAALITAINISVYCIWIPARLQISERYIRINDVWDRCEKIIYLIVDACLNWFFIRLVKQRLVSRGSVKYARLVRFNIRIIFLSLAMDCLIIGCMSLSNNFVYMQVHPLAYIVKLNIEMAMATLIRKIAQEPIDNHASSSGATAVSRSNRKIVRQYIAQTLNPVQLRSTAVEDDNRSSKGSSIEMVRDVWTNYESDGKPRSQESAQIQEEEVELQSLER